MLVISMQRLTGVAFEADVPWMLLRGQIYTFVLFHLTRLDVQHRIFTTQA